MIESEVTGQRSSNLVLSLKLPSSTWVGALAPTEELSDTVMCVCVCVCVCVFLEEEPGPRTIAALLFLHWSFVSAFPPFPDKQLFDSALWNSGKVKEAE